MRTYSRKAFSTYQKALTMDSLTKNHRVIPNYKDSFASKELKNMNLIPSSIIREVLQCCMIQTSTIFDFYQKSGRPFVKQTEPVETTIEVEYDVLALSQLYLESMISIGSYTESSGNPLLRANVAKALSIRDGIKTPVEDIKLVDNILDDFKAVFSTIITNPKICFLFPRPSVPLYEFVARFIGASVANYDIQNDSFDEMLASLDSTIKKTKKDGLDPKVLFFSNPGEPIGRLYTNDQLTKLVDFCFDNELLIYSNESSQQLVINSTTSPNSKPESNDTSKTDNPNKEKLANNKSIDNGENKFISLKKVVKGHKNSAVSEQQELISGFSNSHSIFPEPAIDSGFLEFTNIDSSVMEVLNKLASMLLAPNSPGQIVTDLSLNLQNIKQHFKEGTSKLYQKELNENKSTLLKSHEEFSKALRTIPSFQESKAQAGFFKWVKVDYSQAALKKHGNDVKATEIEYCKTIKKALDLSFVPGQEFHTPGFLKINCVKKYEQTALENLKGVTEKFMNGSK